MQLHFVAYYLFVLSLLWRRECRLDRRIWNEAFFLNSCFIVTWFSTHTDAFLIHHYGFCVPPYSISVATSPSNYKVLKYFEIQNEQNADEIVSVFRANEHSKVKLFLNTWLWGKNGRSNQLFANLHCTSMGKQNLLFRPSAREQCRNEIGVSFSLHVMGHSERPFLFCQSRRHWSVMRKGRNIQMWALLIF